MKRQNISILILSSIIPFGNHSTIDPELIELSDLCAMALIKQPNAGQYILCNEMDKLFATDL